MKSIYIYWNYPKDNVIILWSLIDQFKATHKDIEIHCYVNPDILSLCKIINDKSLMFYSDKIQEKTIISQVLDSSSIEAALLFHCSDELIKLFDDKKMDLFIVSNKLNSKLDIYDNLLDPLEKLIKKVSHHFQLKIIKSEKNLSKLILKNQKELELKRINSNQLVILIDVSGINENSMIPIIIIEFIKDVLKDGQNYIVLIGSANNKDLQEMELDNCINLINKVHFFQIVNLVSKMDFFVGKKGFVSDFFSLKNKMVIEIATNSTKSFLRNRITSSYNTIANLKNINSKNKINVISNLLTSQFIELVTHYNLNIKNSSKLYLNTCFLVDNPILFIFSSNDECKEFINFTKTRYLNYYVVDKWALLNCFKISQIINQYSIKIVIGAVPAGYEFIVRGIEWLKRCPKKLSFINVPLLNQFSISEHIENASFNLQSKQL
jgi:ADP-heptose:LPS heptosyltransferase